MSHLSFATPSLDTDDRHDRWSARSMAELSMAELSMAELSMAEISMIVDHRR
ncbi:MAG: hypothetical protein R2705_18315 [Ilumatobacteraceae bacterium]